MSSGIALFTPLIQHELPAMPHQDSALPIDQPAHVAAMDVLSREQLAMSSNNSLMGTASLRDLKTLILTSQKTISELATQQMSNSRPYAAADNDREGEDEEINQDEEISTQPPLLDRSSRSSNRNQMLENLREWSTEAVELFRLLKLNRVSDADVNRCVEKGKQLLQCLTRGSPSRENRRVSPSAAAAAAQPEERSRGSNSRVAQAVFDWLNSLRAENAEATPVPLTQEQQMELLIRESQREEQAVVAAFQEAYIQNREQQALTNASIQSATEAYDGSQRVFQEHYDRSINLVNEAHQLLMDIGNPIATRIQNLTQYVTQLSASIDTVGERLLQVKSQNGELLKVMQVLKEELANTKQMMIEREEQIKEEEEDDFWDICFAVVASVVVTFVAFHAMAPLMGEMLTSLEVSLPGDGFAIKAIFSF